MHDTCSCCHSHDGNLHSMQSHLNSHHEMTQCVRDRPSKVNEVSLHTKSPLGPSIQGQTSSSANAASPSSIMPSTSLLALRSAFKSALFLSASV